MNEQIGPKRFLQQLREQAPMYAKILPMLPRLMHDYLAQRHAVDKQQLERLVEEQKRTNGTLQVLLYLAAGFVASMLILQAWTVFHPFL